MNTLMITVLSLSLSGSVFIAILYWCKALYRERLSRRWQYYIWLIVVVRMLLPFSFEVNLIGSLFNGIGRVNSVAFVEMESGNIANDVGWNTSGARIDQHVPAPVILGTHNAVPHSQDSVFDMLISNLWLIWLVVALLLFVRKLTIYQSFARYIRAGRVELTCIDDYERFGKILEQSGIRRMVGIYTNSLVSSPLLIGFFQPYIVLPTMDISESDFRYTILHELTHYKRGDMFYKWLVQLVVCLHWFNPLIYLMEHEITNACEFSCDESVIRDLDYHEIRAYGDALLNALRVDGRYKNPLPTLTLGGNKKIIGERLNMIKKFKKKSRLAIVVALCVTIFLGVGAVALGAYAMPSQQPAVERNTIPIVLENIRIPTSTDFFSNIWLVQPNNVVVEFPAWYTDPMDIFNPITPYMAQEDARRIATSLVVGNEWVSNMEQVRMVDNRNVYAFLFINAESVGHFIVIDSHGGDILVFALTELENPWSDLFGSFDAVWSRFFAD